VRRVNFNPITGSRRPARLARLPGWLEASPREPGKTGQGALGQGGAAQGADGSPKGSAREGAGEGEIFFSGYPVLE